MYSPKIHEDLIPILYKIGKEQKMPMTKVVDDIIRRYLNVSGNNSKYDFTDNSRNHPQSNSCNAINLRKQYYCLDDMDEFHEIS